MEYLPWAHPELTIALEHLDEPDNVLFHPEGQFLQAELDDAPVSLENCPTEQLLQRDLETKPVLDEYVPAGQSVHVACLGIADQ